MNPVRIAYLLCLILLTPSLESSTKAQVLEPPPIILPDYSGSNKYSQHRTSPRQACLSSNQREVLNKRISFAVDSLTKAGVLQDPTMRNPGNVLYEWPLRQAAGFDNCGYYAITNYVDQDCVSGQLLDYNCQQYTYDLTGPGLDHCGTNDGYDHAGIDIAPFPFDWTMVDNNQVEVIAAAPGILLDKVDGNFDENCDFSSDTPNYAVVLHTDNTYTLYLHLKNGSLTTTAIGAPVATGDLLGIVASSGLSTGPHLHFEVRDYITGALYDPYAGPCNSLNANSCWSNQMGYLESGINRVMTHSAPIQANPCPQRAVINEQDTFCPGETVFFGSYFRNPDNTESSQNMVRMPDNTVFQTWTRNMTTAWANDWIASYVLPNNAMAGTWTYEVTFNGETCSHNFTVLPGPDAEFSYTSNRFCNDQANPTAMHSTGSDGTYNSSTGLVFANAANGTIDLAASTPGTYTITNNISNSCGNGSENQEVTIIAAPFAGNDTTVDACNDGSTTAFTLADLLIGEDAGGSWMVAGSSPTVPGPGFNAGAGTFDPNQESVGSYQFAYTVSATPCTSQSAIITVNISAPSSAGSASSTAEVCATTETPAVILDNLLSGQDPGGTWTETSTSLSTSGLSNGNEFNPVGEAAGTYAFTYTQNNGACGIFSTEVFVTVTVPCCDASFDYGINPANFCITDALQVANFSDSNGGFTVNPAIGLDLDPVSGSISAGNSLPGTYTVTHSVTTNAGCEETVTVIIDAQADAGIATGEIPVVCNIANTDPIDLNELLAQQDTGGTWSEISTPPSTGLSGNIFDPVSVPSGLYEFEYAVDGGACPDAFQSVFVEIVDPCCDAGFSYDVSPVAYCTTDSGTAPFVADTDGAFYANPAGLSIDQVTGQIDPTSSVPGTYTVTHEVYTNIGCSETVEVVIDELASAGVAQSTYETCNIPGSSIINLDDLLDGETGGGTWTETSAVPSVSGLSGLAGNTFNPVGELGAYYHFQYTVYGGACPNDINEVNIFIKDPCCEAEAGEASVIEARCPGDLIEVFPIDFNTDANYELYILAVDTDTGLIVEVLGGAASNIATSYILATSVPGEYEVYLLSQESGNGTTLAATVGADFEELAQEGECYDIQEVVGNFNIPAPFTSFGGIANSNEGDSGNLLPVYYNMHQIHVGGGTPPYQYDFERTGYVRWSIGDVDDPIYQQTAEIAYADNAEWSLTISDANNCSDSSLTFSNDSGIGGGNASVATDGNILDIDDFSISGQSATNIGGSIDITVVGCDGGPYSFAWVGPGSFTSTAEDIANLDSGHYTLTVTCGDQITYGYYWVPMDRSSGRLKTTPGPRIEISPNPARNTAQLSLELTETSRFEAEIYDSNGRLIKAIDEGELARGSYSIDLHMAELPEGIYICRSIVGGKVLVKRIAIVR